MTKPIPEVKVPTQDFPAQDAWALHVAACSACTWDDTRHDTVVCEAGLKLLEAAIDEIVSAPDDPEVPPAINEQYHDRAYVRHLLTSLIDE